MMTRCAVAISLVFGSGCGKSSSKTDDDSKTTPPPPPPPTVDAAPAAPAVEAGPAGVAGAYQIEIAVPADYTCRIKPESKLSFEIVAGDDTMTASGLTWEVADVRFGGRPGALTLRTKAPDDAAQLNLELAVAGADVAGVASFMVMDEDAKCEIIKAAKITGSRTPPAK